MRDLRAIFEGKKSRQQDQEKNEEEERLMQFYENKKFDVEIEELRDYKEKLNQHLITKDVKIGGSSLWSINKAIDLINTSLLSEIDFLYKDIFNILTNHYKDPSKEAKFKKQFEMFFKSILSGMLTKASKKLTKKKIPNGQVD